jgi:hypothetical protein
MTKEDFWRDRLLSDSIIDEATFKQAMQYAFDGSLMEIIRGNELIHPLDEYQYIIQTKVAEFDMEVCGSCDEAIALCEKMGWNYEVKL